MTCTRASRSRPSASPASSASASVSALAAATALLMSLTPWPWPTGPHGTTSSPIASNSGRARSSCAASPPTMIVSVPSSALGEDPDTGASRKATPRVPSSSPIDRASAGAIVLMSTQSVPGPAPATAPSRPRSSSRTCGPSTTIVITAPAPRAASAGVAATSPPWACAQPSAVLRVRFHTTRSNPARARFAAIREPMIPSPRKATRSAGTVAPAARGLDPQHLAGSELAARLGRDLLVVDEVASRLPVLAAVGAAGGVAAALGDERVGHGLERLDGADDAVAPAVRAAAARAAPDGVLAHAHGELELERFHRGVQRVAHGHVDARRAVGVRARALAAAERLVVGEGLRAEGEVVHRSLPLGPPERGEHHVGHAGGRLDVPADDRGGRPGVEQGALGSGHREGTVRPRTGRDVGVRQDPDGEVRGRAGDGHGAVEVARVLVGGAGEVKLELVAPHVGGDRDPQVALGALENVLRRVLAVLHRLE